MQHARRDFGHRRSLRLKGHDYAAPGAYFITVVIENRVCCLGEVFEARAVLSPAGQLVQATWEALPSRFSNLNTDSVVVMPNHVHGILHFDSVSPDRPVALGDVVGAFKSMTTAGYAHAVKTQGWPPFRNRLWQRNYFERIIRDERSLEFLRDYIANNPARWDVDQENPRRDHVAWV